MHSDGHSIKSVDFFPQVGQEFLDDLNARFRADAFAQREVLSHETLPDETLPDETLPDETLPDETLPAVEEEHAAFAHVAEGEPVEHVALLDVLQTVDQAAAHMAHLEAHAEQLEAENLKSHEEIDRLRAQLDDLREQLAATKASAEFNLMRAQKAEALATKHNSQAKALQADIATIASAVGKAFTIAPPALALSA